MLLVDERDGVTSLLEQHLELQGFEVVRAADRAGALKLSRELYPDIVVVEATEGVTQGFDLARDLQRWGLFSPPVVLLVAEADEEALKTARADGAIVACAVAPADLQEIVTQVRSALRSASAARKRSFLRVPEHAEDAGDETMLCALNLVDVVAGFLQPAPEASRP